MAQWPVSTSTWSQHIAGEHAADTKRSSLATLVDFGDWISGQSRDRPPSLLLPAPQLIHLPCSDTRVECRLSSSVTPPNACPSTASSPKREFLGELSAHLQEISFSDGTTSLPPTRPITPVPSLTTSNHSRSSFGVADISPSTTMSSPNAQLLSSPLSKNMMATSKKPARVRVTGPLIHSVSSPFPSPTFHQDDHAGWSTSLVDSSRKLSYLPFRPMLSADVNVIATEQRESASYPQEISSFDWEDHEAIRSDSALGRLKKSFTDMRAAERFITEASTRSKVQAAKSVRGDSPSSMGCGSSNTGRTFHGGIHSNSGQRASYTPAPVRLQKKPSIKTTAMRIRSPSTESPATPPSAGKKKYTNTMSSQRSQEVPKKKPKSGTVAKLVGKLLRTKKDH